MKHSIIYSKLCWSETVAVERPAWLAVSRQAIMTIIMEIQLVCNRFGIPLNTFKPVLHIVNNVQFIWRYQGFSGVEFYEFEIRTLNV